MNKNLRFVVVALAVMTSCLFWGNAPARADSADEGVGAGAQLWANACARCHNMRDPGEFRDQNWRPIVSHMRIRAGLTGEDSRQILAFLQRSNQPTLQRIAADSSASGPAVADPAAGAVIYQRDCVACHGKDGKGTLPGVRNFNAADGPLAKSDDELVRNITNGYKSPQGAMAMPPNGGNPGLTNADVRAVLQYLRQTFGKRS